MPDKRAVCVAVDVQDVFLPRLASRKGGAGLASSKYTPSMSRIASGIGLDDMAGSESTANSAREWLLCSSRGLHGCGASGCWA